MWYMRSLLPVWGNGGSIHTGMYYRLKLWPRHIFAPISEYIFVAIWGKFSHFIYNTYSPSPGLQNKVQYEYVKEKKKISNWDHFFGAN